MQGQLTPRGRKHVEYMMLGQCAAPVLHVVKSQQAHDHNHVIDALWRMGQSLQAFLLCT